MQNSLGRVVYYDGNQSIEPWQRFLINIEADSLMKLLNPIIRKHFSHMMGVIVTSRLVSFCK